MLFFLIIIFGIPLLSLAWWWWAHRRLSQLEIPAIWRWMFSLALIVLLVGFTWIILARREMVDAAVPPAVYAAVLLWGLIFLPFVALPMMTTWAMLATGKFFTRKLRPITDSTALHPADPARRRLLGATVVALPLLATFGTAGITLPRTQHFRIRTLTVKLKDLPPALDGMTIAHVTDTHVGKFTRGALLDRIAKATTELGADLILLTGDLIDNSIKDLPAALAMVRQMRARYGLFMVEGNHDLFDDPEEFVRQTHASGVPLLRNQAALLQVRGHPVQIMGIPWNRSEARIANDVANVMTLKEFDSFPILLAHHPHAFDAAAEHGIPLTLAGHTHGGQLMLTEEIGAGPAMYKYWSGLYQKADRALIVSNGAGNWFPLRTHAPAEIIHLTLRRA